MARENKRKREERRFGKSDRLADALRSAETVSGFENIPGHGSALRALIARAVSVTADNVVRYFEADKKKEWNWSELPTVRLPFPSLLVESTFIDPVPRTGLLLAEGPPAADFHRILRETCPRRPESPESLTPDDVDRLMAGCAHMYHIAILAQTNWTIACPAHGTLLLDDEFRPTSGPLWRYTRNPEMATGGPASYANMLSELAFPLLLAVSFMNCRNVAVKVHEPDRAVNRARARHGLKPFIRYHTIDIEPMKTVLRTEGRADELGLKHAFHEVRGHLVRYTKERPLFGKHAGTFWVPLHYRGDPEQGVVVKDYNVNPPRPQEDETHD